MAAAFLDSSALAKRYIDEEGTSAVVAVIERAEPPVVSRLAFVEVTSACARRVRAGHMNESQFDQVTLALERDFREVYAVIELGGAVMSRAAQLARGRYLRAADAIQLACAMIAAGQRPAGTLFEFVSADDELNAAAANEGLTVVNPCDEAKS